MKKSFSLFVIFGIVAVLLISGCTQQQPKGTEPTGIQTPVQTPAGQPASEQPVVRLSAGNYIVDDKGNTLYFFTKDVMGNSSCTGGCLNNWPIFYQEKIVVSSGLSSLDFGTITRDDRKKQTTYKGWPLYYFSGDENPGDIKGEGVNKVWFIARPDYTIFIADKDTMKFIVDANGNTLYNFTNDMPGVSNCKGNCLKTWPVFYSENIVSPSLINTSVFGVITNSEGAKQTTYKQMPLYYYINDTKRGDTNGQNVNKAWFVVGTESSPPLKIITPTPVATQTTGGYRY